MHKFLSNTNLLPVPLLITQDSRLEHLPLSMLTCALVIKMCYVQYVSCRLVYINQVFGNNYTGNPEYTCLYLLAVIWTQKYGVLSSFFSLRYMGLKVTIAKTSEILHTNKSRNFDKGCTPREALVGMNTRARIASGSQKYIYYDPAGSMYVCMQGC